MAGSSSTRKVQIGETVKLGKAATMVRLPDGTVVTARGQYVVQHEGEHKIVGGASFTGVKG